VIRLRRKTRERLKGIGRKGETHDQAINRVLDEVEKRGRKPR